MSDNMYAYAVARIRSKELSLLSKSDIEQLMACKDHQECVRILKDKGWGRAEDHEDETILAYERKRTWDMIRELTDDMSVFDTFLYENDFHNLKAGIKLVYINQEIPGIFVSDGKISAEIILQAVKSHDFSMLPEYMEECAEEAYQVQFHTGNSQLCDAVIDKQTLKTMQEAGKASGNEVLSQYAEIKTASADINIAIRSSRTGKGKEFLLRAMAECDSLDVQKLAEAALKGEEEIFEYLSSTNYSSAIGAIKESSSAFERWCDNLIMESIRSQKQNPFTLSPLAAFILARDMEMKSVRILLSGKRNHLGEQVIRERMRDTYV